MSKKSFILTQLNEKKIFGDAEFELIALWENSQGELALVNAEGQDRDLALYSLEGKILYLDSHTSREAAITELENLAKFAGARRVNLTVPEVPEPYRDVFEKLLGLDVIMMAFAANADDTFTVLANVGSWPERRQLQRVGLDVVDYPDTYSVLSRDDEFGDFVIKRLELV